MNNSYGFCCCLVCFLLSSFNHKKVIIAFVFFWACRYDNADPMILAVEGFAAFADGILCLYWIWSIVHKKWYRHPIQLLTSGLHAFGTVVFLLHEIVQGSPNTKPAFDIPYGLGFIGSNSVWIVIPLILMKQSMDAMRPALEKASTNNTKKD